MNKIAQDFQTEFPPNRSANKDNSRPFIYLCDCMQE